MYTYLDKQYKIEVIRKNNRNTYIRIKNNMVIVTTNYLVTNRQIERLISDNKDKIDNMLSDYLLKEEKKEVYNNKNIVSLFGIDYYVIYNSEFNINGDTIYVKDKKELDKYINNLMVKIFSERLDYYYNMFKENIPYPNLKIRKMKTRWGVCNIKNHNVTLNYELVRLNTKYLDYVIVHELSHFIYPNHQKEFWDLVEKYYPNYKVIRKYLRKRETV